MSSSVPADGDGAVQQGYTVLKNEANIDSIRALEEQIREHEMAIIRLKRARNSLLNVSRLPPEILGDVFRRNVTTEADFGRLGRGSYNFLFVCHHWFAVASCTPELWSFWGDTLEDWKDRHLQYPNAPLDLVFNNEWGYLDDSVRDALRDRAARDTVRRIHLKAIYSKTLESILSPLSNPLPREIRSNSVESIILVDRSRDTSVDVSDFFARYRFPNLRRLELSNCMISSWGVVVAVLRASVLTTLSLGPDFRQTVLTTPQLLSILNSNPTLRKISLCEGAIPDNNGFQSSFRVPLRNLRELLMVGERRRVFGFLHRLDLPDRMDRLAITLDSCTTEDIAKSIGPYLRDFLRQRGRSQGGLGLYLSKHHKIRLRVGDVGGVDFSAPGSAPVNNFVEISVRFDRTLPGDLLAAANLDLIAYIPREEIAYFHAYRDPIAMERVSEQFPYLRALRLQKSTLRVAFPKSLGLKGRKKIFPSLQHVTLVESSREDWSPLTAFLTRRASSGNRLDTLEVEVEGFYDMDLGVGENITKLVREFRGGLNLVLFDQI